MVVERAENKARDLAAAAANGGEFNYTCIYIEREGGGERHGGGASREQSARPRRGRREWG